MEDTLLKHVLSHNSRYIQPLRVLLLQNRAALRRQTITRIASIIVKYTGDDRYLEALNDYSDTGLKRHFMRLGNILVATYQFLATPDGEKLLTSESFALTIMDEAHFFASDALFNEETETILKLIVRYCHDATRIYLSATIETAFEAIARAEYDEWKRRRKPTRSSHDAIAPFTAEGQWSFYKGLEALRKRTERFHIRFYDLERDYRYVTGLHRIAIEDLPNEITKGTGRWLVFVPSIAEGQTLLTILKAKEVNAVLLTSESKKSPAFENLTHHETIDVDVIIATAVIDNGVNIRDERITDIAIMLFDRTEFLQMLGRLRIKDASQTIRVWVSEWTPDELLKQLLCNVRSLVDRLRLENLSSEGKQALIPTYLKFKDGFGVDPVKSLYYNPLALYSLLESIQRITSILRNSNQTFTVSLNEESPYYALTLRALYDATRGRLPMADAVSRALLGLNLLEDKEFMEAQIGWKHTTAADDSFLYFIYSLRIKNLQQTLHARTIREDDIADACRDAHPNLSDKDLNQAIRRQQKLQQRFGKSLSAWEEIYYWLELDAPKDKVANEKFSSAEVSGELLMKFSVTEETLESVCSENDKCHDRKFLTVYGLPKKGSTALNASKAKAAQAFITLKAHYSSQADNADISITKLMNMTKKQPFRLDDHEFHIESRLSPSNETIYLIIRTPITSC